MVQPQPQPQGVGVPPVPQYANPNMGVKPGAPGALPTPPIRTRGVIQRNPNARPDPQKVEPAQAAQGIIDE
jgi:hypothetical protein